MTLSWSCTVNRRNSIPQVLKVTRREYSRKRGWEHWGSLSMSATVLQRHVWVGSSCHACETLSGEQLEAERRKRSHRDRGSYHKCGHGRYCLLTWENFTFLHNSDRLILFSKTLEAWAFIIPSPQELMFLYQYRVVWNVWSHSRDSVQNTLAR